MSPAGENSSGGPAPANARKRDAKAEDPEGGTDCWEDIERSMTVPCVAATVLGMMLFTVLAALAFKQIGKPAPVGVFTGRTHKGRLPPNTLDPAKSVEVNSEQPVASWMSPKVLPGALEIDIPQLIDGEIYGAGRAELHRVDAVKDFQSDVIRTHGKMMAVRATGLQDIGPFLAFIHGPTVTHANGAQRLEVPTASRLAYHPEGVMLMVFATASGNLYARRIRTGLNPGATEGWERGSQWSAPQPAVENHSGNIHHKAQDPVLFYDAHADAFRVIYTGFIDKTMYYLYMISSKDHGASWTWPEQIYVHPGCRSFGNVLRPTSQDYLLPILRERDPGTGEAAAVALLSDDHAVSWREAEIEPPGDAGHSGPAVVALRDGSVVAYLSPPSSDTLRMRTSTDGGKTWGASVRTDIPNSGIASYSATLLASGNVAIVFVNHFNAPGKTVKSPLSIAVSLDAKGAIFAHVRDLELANGHELGGYSVSHDTMSGFDHPSVVQTPNGMLHITYTVRASVPTTGRKKAPKPETQHFIKYVAVDEEWVARGSSLPSRGVYQGLSDPAWRQQHP
eukprot:jgi/Tetstr1/441617/TSEL_029844.t1